jgi:predicted nuclease of predicted toxin-antitoxin system
MPCRRAWLNCLSPQVMTRSMSEPTDCTASDEEILARALREDRVVVSADSDFGVLLAAQEADHPSFILFREPNLLIARDYAAMLIPALEMLAPELAGGCVAVFRHGLLRIRKLPFSA